MEEKNMSVDWVIYNRYSLALPTETAGPLWRSGERMWRHASRNINQDWEVTLKMMFTHHQDRNQGYETSEVQTFWALVYE